MWFKIDTADSRFEFAVDRRYTNEGTNERRETCLSLMSEGNEIIIMINARAALN